MSRRYPSSHRKVLHMIVLVSHMIFFKIIKYILHCLIFNFFHFTVDGQKVLILDQIVQRVFGLGTEVKRLMVRGKMILIRIFISGMYVLERLAFK